MLKVVSTLYLLNGGRTRSSISIEDADLQKLARYFDRSGPQRLQEEVAYNILYYLGGRGREAFHQLDRTSFMLEKDSSGMQYYPEVRRPTRVLSALHSAGQLPWLHSRYVEFVCRYIGDTDVFPDCIPLRLQHTQKCEKANSCK